MPLTDDQISEIDAALETWRQGDFACGEEHYFVHLADLNRPTTGASELLSDIDNADKSEPNAIWEAVPGLVVLSQTCDIVRSCKIRPYVEVAPLMTVDLGILDAVQKMKMPNRAFLAGAASRHFVVDLDRTMTIEKSILSGWKREIGCQNDEDVRRFAEALGRKRTRFAFPDDFVQAMEKLQKRFIGRAGKNSPEGAHIDALREIRVRAAPSWDAERVVLDWWFIKDREPATEEIKWVALKEEWLDLLVQTGRFSIASSIVCRLNDLTAADYVESDHLDLDRLSDR